MVKGVIVLAFLIAAAITAWRIRAAKRGVQEFLQEAKRAGFEVFPAESDEQPVRIGRVRVAATVRVFETTLENGRKTQEMHLLWTLALRGDETARGALEVQKGGGGYGGMNVDLGRRLTASVKDAAALDWLDDRAKKAIAALDVTAPLIAFNAVGPEMSASFARKRTDLATAKALATGFDAAARALGR